MHRQYLSNTYKQSDQSSRTAHHHPHPHHPTEESSPNLPLGSHYWARIVLWENILAVFHDALYVRHETGVLPFMKDIKFRTLSPQRIAAIPDATLEIVIEGQVPYTEAGTSQTIPEQVFMDISVNTSRGGGEGGRSTYYPPPPPPTSFLSTQDSSSFIAPAPSNKTPRAPECLSGDYVDYRMYDHTPLPSDAHYVPPAAPIDVVKIADTLSRTYLGSAGADQHMSGKERGYGSRPGPQAIVDDRLKMPFYQQQQCRVEQNQDQHGDRIRQQSPLTDLKVVEDLQPALHVKEEDLESPETLSAYKCDAENGSASAAYAIALQYDNGLDGTLKDDKKAAEWYMISAKQGYASAQYNLAVMYDEGRGLQQSDAEAMEWYLHAAAQDHAGAAYNLGLFYEHGQGVLQSFTEAMHWYMKAAELGHDLHKAFEWYLRAAEQEHASAEHNLGVMYENGEAPGLQDYTKAMEYYLRASSRGHARAQFSVGLLYDTGKGIDQNSRKALEWYLKSAELNHAPAQFNVGFMYEHGEEVSRDLGVAFEWYLRAAKQEHAKAQYSVGVFYQRGIEGKVARDLRVAKDWLEKAVAQGHELAPRDLEAVRILMKDSGMPVASSPIKVQVQAQAGSKGGFSKLKSLWKR
ncbi:hypothetical protein BG015_010272 [Linnemannia schmuckeri]|uniref:HCP-like protein n=1 Tax=Linnemannia schmuckeri TaxID=64567 RepID=A0A9P5RUD3_9FUNG|nr:hypothetical protein BG015_010272 [Linnemannia schmuckeri]